MESTLTFLIFSKFVYFHFYIKTKLRAIVGFIENQWNKIKNSKKLQLSHMISYVQDILKSLVNIYFKVKS